MTVAEIQGAVAMYLQRSVAKFDVSGTNANLLLVAMNNARKYAERKHNWSVSRKKGYLSVTTGNKVSWDSPVWFDAGTEKLKEGKHWWLRSTTDTINEWNQSDVPLKVIQHGVKHVVETKRQYQAMGDEWEAYVSDTNSTCHPLLNQSHGVLRGKWLELYPRPTVTTQVVVDGFYWWPNWTGIGVVSSFFLPDLAYSANTQGSYLKLTVNNGDSNSTFFNYYYIFLDVAGSSVSVAFPYADAGVVVLNAASIAKATLIQVLTKLGLTATSATGGIDIQVSGANPSITAQGYDAVGAVDVFAAQALTETSVSSGSGETDWWTENAEEFLILRTLVECNRLGHVFTGNKEGNLPSPEKAAEQALQVLIDQDNAGELAGGQIELY